MPRRNHREHEERCNVESHVRQWQDEQIEGPIADGRFALKADM